MASHLRVILLAGLVLRGLVSASCLRAQPQVAQTPAHPYASLRYDENYAALRDPAKRTDGLDGLKFIGLNAAQTAYLSLGGEARLRYQYFHNEDWGATPYATSGSLEQRYLLHADVHLGAHVRAFGQLQSSLQNFQRGGHGSLEVDRFGLHQAFIDLVVPLVDSSSITLRPGRQELYYGNGKLVDPREAPNIRRSFDAVRILVQHHQWRTDLFVAKPVVNNPGLADDRDSDTQTFWGVYATGPLPWQRSKATLDVYYLGIRNEEIIFSQGVGRELRHTLGFRLASQGEHLDYGLESMYQFGSFAGGTIRAGNVTGGVGYTLRARDRSLRLSLGGGVGSGGQQAGSATLTTYNPLYPTGYYFGPPAQAIGPSNLLTLWPEVSLKPTPAVALVVGASLLWRQSLTDGVYSRGVALLLPAQASAARYIGTQFNLTASWQVQRHLTLALWAAYFSTGRFLEDGTPGRDIGYLLPFVTFRF
jgi:hypothetical protein